MINKNSNLDTNQTYSITDIKQCFWSLGAALFVGFFTVIIFNKQPEIMFCGLIIIIILIWRFVIVAMGFIVDPSSNTLAFWGGGVEANSILDYINPIFWLQSLRRFTIKLDEIESIACDVKCSADKEGKIHVNHYLYITGAFGAVNIRFYSEGKQRQAYTLLAQLHEMGSPISNR